MKRAGAGAVVLACLALATAARAGETEIDLSGAANRSWVSDWGVGSFPTGQQTYNGVGFDIASDAQGARYASAIYGSTDPIVLDMDVRNATSASSLINTIWGQPGPASYLSITFTGSAGFTQTFSLVGRVDIRDFNNYAYTNTINGTTTKNAVTVDGGAHRLDQQFYALDPAFMNQDLVSVTMTDTGGDGFSRGALTGLTIETAAGAAPEPSAWALMMIGVALAGASLRQRRPAPTPA